MDLEQKLQKRLDEAFQKRESQQAQVKLLQNDVQRLLSKMPKRHRETVAELHKKMDDLERKRTITSVSLAEERQILKQINFAKKQISQVEEYQGMDQQVQEKKSKINELRDAQRVGSASIDEIEAALSKVKLANKFGLTTQDLATVQIDCPRDKVGMVIGKNGSMIKQIMDRTKVNIDVRKEDNKITIVGSQEAVDKAAAEIDSITRAIERELEVPKDLLAYLTARHVSILPELKKKYEGTYLELLRASGKAVIRGAPERVAEAEAELMGTEVVSEKRTLTGREFGYLLGRKGSTIDKLVSTHKVSIDVDKVNDETATAVVIGPPDLVAGAMNDIDDLMNDNREITEYIPVDVVVKRIMLSDAGAHIKALQAKVNESLKEADANCYLSFPKDQADKDHPELLVKCKQSAIATAVELTEEGMKGITALVVSLMVDPYIVPTIIGKGGETIKKLTHDKPAFLEVDRSSGKVVVGATTAEERDALLAEVNQMVEDNSVVRIKGDPSMMRAQYRELNRSKSKAAMQELARLDIDDDESVFILRGKKENLEKAQALLDEFVVNNFLDEMAITEEDQDVLLTGGKSSKIMKLSEEAGVHLFADRGRHVVTIRGTKENVAAAKEKLGRFLNGGDGHIVVKLSVNEQVVGTIIGKGGKTRKELEEKHSPVSIHISKTFRVSIRGPDEQANACRVEIFKMISSAKVTQSVPISSKQHEKLQKNDAIKRISQQSNAQITLGEKDATVRGLFYGVRDAVSLLNEQLTGEYKSLVELDASQFARVSAITSDPTHFGRMESSTRAKVSLATASGSIQVSGKRNNVRKAKDQVYGFLEFACEGEFARLKISKPLYASVGQATSLAEVAAEVGGVTVYLDRDISSVVIRDLDQEKVKSAVKLVGEKITEAERLAYVLEIVPAEAWLLSYIIGKEGNRIEALQKGSDCAIDVSKEARTVTVTGESEEEVSAVREKLEALVEQGLRENLFLDIPEKAMPSFIGKGGNHIKELFKQHDVEIERLRKGNTYKVSGDAFHVEAAKITFDDWLRKWQQSHGSSVISIEKAFIPAVLGAKGSTANAIKKEFGCMVDVDRQALTVSVHGGSEEMRGKALNKIQDIIEKAKDEKAAAAAAEETAPAPKAAPKAAAKASTSVEPAAIRHYQFNPEPVGVPPSKNNGGKKGKKVESSVQHGTAQGRNLFNLLVDDDAGR